MSIGPVFIGLLGLCKGLIAKLDIALLPPGIIVLFAI